MTAWFEAMNNTATRKTASAPDDKVLCLSTADVRRTLAGVNKAVGPDSVLLRECADQLADVLSDIFNISLSQAVVPSCLKNHHHYPSSKKVNSDLPQ